MKVVRRGVPVLAWACLACSAARPPAASVGPLHAGAFVVERAVAQATRQRHGGQRLGFQDSRLPFGVRLPGQSWRTGAEVSLLLQELGAELLEASDSLPCGVTARTGAECPAALIRIPPPMITGHRAIGIVYGLNLVTGTRYQRLHFFRLIDGRAIGGGMVDSSDLAARAPATPDTSDAGRHLVAVAAAEHTRLRASNRRLVLDAPQHSFEGLPAQAPEERPRTQRQLDELAAALGGARVIEGGRPGCISADDPACPDLIVRIGVPVIDHDLAIVTVYGSVPRSGGQTDLTHLFRWSGGAWRHVSVIDSRDAQARE